jgi:hypothetical protein
MNHGRTKDINEVMAHDFLFSDSALCLLLAGREVGGLKLEVVSLVGLLALLV